MKKRTPKDESLFAPLLEWKAKARRHLMKEGSLFRLGPNNSVQSSVRHLENLNRWLEEQADSNRPKT